MCMVMTQPVQSKILTLRDSESDQSQQPLNEGMIKINQFLRNDKKDKCVATIPVAKNKEAKLVKNKLAKTKMSLKKLKPA